MCEIYKYAVFIIVCWGTDNFTSMFVYRWYCYYI